MSAEWTTTWRMKRKIILQAKISKQIYFRSFRFPFFAQILFIYTKEYVWDKKNIDRISGSYVYVYELCICVWYYDDQKHSTAYLFIKFNILLWFSSKARLVLKNHFSFQFTLWVSLIFGGTFVLTYFGCFLRCLCVFTYENFNLPPDKYRTFFGLVFFALFFSYFKMYFCSYVHTSSTINDINIYKWFKLKAEIV